MSVFDFNKYAITGYSVYDSWSVLYNFTFVLSYDIFLIKCYLWQFPRSTPIIGMKDTTCKMHYTQVVQVNKAAHESSSHWKTHLQLKWLQNAQKKGSKTHGVI